VLLPLVLARQRIGRRGGAVLLAGYLAYLAWLASQA
jgi:hypothetical protein